MSAEPDEPNYIGMQPDQMLSALGDDGMEWARAFCQVLKKNYDVEIDAGWACSWFANAIENSWDVRTRRAQPPTKPNLTIIK